ncbi:MAG TPA: protein-L-isoaspartate O-methyltransferase [Gammaproteobacteria bacterium]|nr:protein-L-isoaspartate O-methyltransferase [Gammaproteobacteria bacterium]
MDNLQKARLNMIHSQVRPWDVRDEKVLNMMNTIPREQFVPKEFEDVAYSDCAIPLNETHKMLAPKVVARALQALAIQPTETALEIGTGTGYVTALLSHLANHVYSIEIDPMLLNIAKRNLSQGYKNVTLELGNAVFGWQSHAPYAVIFVSGSYPLGLPTALETQILPGGRCFAIIGQEPNMQAVLYTRTSKRLKPEVLFETSSAALLHAPHPQEFTF